MHPFPAEFEKPLAHPIGAMALMYSLLLEPAAASRERQLRRIQRHGVRGVLPLAIRFEPLLFTLPREAKLPLVEAAIPALKLLPRLEYLRFMENLLALARADAKLTLFEYLLITVVERRVGTERGSTVRYHSIEEVASYVRTLLSGLAHHGGDSFGKRLLAYEKSAIPLGIMDLMLDPAECTLDRIEFAMRGLRQTSPEIKRKIADASIRCIETNGVVPAEGSDLLRLVCEAMRYELPPPNLAANSAGG